MNLKSEERYVGSGFSFLLHGGCQTGSEMEFLSRRNTETDRKRLITRPTQCQTVQRLIIEEENLSCTDPNCI